MINCANVAPPKMPTEVEATNCTGDLTCFNPESTRKLLKFFMDYSRWLTEYEVNCSNVNPTPEVPTPSP